MNLAAEDLTTEEILDQWLDREIELQQCLLSLIQHRNNVLIRGKKGVGKTFMLRRLSYEIDKLDDFKSVNVHLAHLMSYDTNNALHEFPVRVLTQLCISAWKDIIGKSFLELEQGISYRESHAITQSKIEIILLDIYHRLLSKSIRESSEWNDKIGASAVLFTSKSQARSREFERGGMQPHQFVEYLEILQNEVFMPSGVRNLVVFCDEANLLSLENQEQILARYFEVFLTKKIQFVFSIGYWDVELKFDRHDLAFDLVQDISGFESLGDIRALVMMNLQDEDEETVEVIASRCHKEYSGIPRQVITLCGIYSNLTSSKQVPPSLKLINSSFEVMNRRLEHMNRTLKDA